MEISKRENTVNFIKQSLVEQKEITETVEKRGREAKEKHETEIRELELKVAELQ